MSAVGGLKVGISIVEQGTPILSVKSIAVENDACIRFSIAYVISELEQIHAS